MGSFDLKTEALCWLRFGKKLELVCTEGGCWAADVLGISDKFSVEVEVKVSKADLRREFSTKRSKHYLYNNVAAEAAPPRQVPNYFYFYVPPELEQEALKLIEEHSPKAGLAVFDPEAKVDGKRTRVVRKPTRLHDKEPSQQFKRTVLLRMGSELCGRYVVWRDHIDKVHEALIHLDQTIVDTVKKAFETPDAEE